MNAEREGPYQGSRCLVLNEGNWELSEIKRVNEDGTFNVEPVKSRAIFGALNYGVPLTEIRFNDRDCWDECFAKLASDPGGLSINDFSNALKLSGLVGPPAVVKKFWNSYCKETLHLPKSTTNLLDAESAYGMFVEAGMSATKLMSSDTASNTSKYQTIYYNSIRMGGRNPSEIAREVTLHDAFMGLGVEDMPDDAARLEAMVLFEAEHDIKFPAALRSFLAKKDIETVLSNDHPNGPRLIEIKKLAVRNVADSGLKGDRAVAVLTREEFQWHAVFSQGDADARIYVTNSDRELSPQFRLVAPTVGMFFWDLAQTALLWYQDRFENVQFPRTDIGIRHSEQVASCQKQLSDALDQPPPA